MARPQRSRRICVTPEFNVFRPSSRLFSAETAEEETIVLTLDEFEALRLIDHEGLTHSDCAVQMNISRTTVTEICESARKKVADALVLGKTLAISGGQWELCKGGRNDCNMSSCFRAEDS